MRTPPPMIAGLSTLAGRYDVLFCDVWGVVHDGLRAYPAADEALRRFRADGGTVILVSNAPNPSHRVATLLDQRQVSRAAWDRIACSGDVARGVLAARGATRVHHIGPDRDIQLLDGFARVPIVEAEIALVSGLADDRTETGEDYRPRLAALLAAGLDLVCANPDRVVDLAGTLLPCAGAVADIYDHMGGRVIWCGKPYAPIYAAARRLAAEVRGAAVPDARILAIGDSVITDLAGAADAGIDALLVTTGIHREAVTRDGALDADALARLIAGHRPPIGVMTGLAW